MQVLLEEDDTGAVRKLNQLRDAVRISEVQAEWVKLGQCLEQYDFEGALEVFSEVRNKLGIRRRCEA